MVAIVSGNSLGLSLTSLATLGQRGVAGSATQGRNGEAVYVNTATGNLVLQDRDDYLVGHGVSAAALRTYNSQGLLSDDNGDNWSTGVFAQQLQLTGTRNTAGSTLTRTDRDGAQAVYTYNASNGSYVSTEGAGAFDSITYDSANSVYVWNDGSSGLQERYESASTGRLLSSTDPSGNSLTYTYTGNLLTLVVDASGDRLYYDYSGNNLTQVRTVTAGNVTTIRTRYDYDTSNRLWHVTTDLTPEDNSVSDGKTYVTTYTYDGTSNRVETISQTDGTSLSFGYTQIDGSWKVTSVVDALGHATTFNYAGAVTRVTDALNAETRFTKDSEGRLLQIEAPAVAGVSQVNSFSYNAAGDLIQVVDGGQHAVDMAYDDHGNQTQQRDAAGNTVSRTFNARSQLATETVYLTPDTDGAGPALPSQPLTTRYVYDAANKNLLRFVLSPEGRVTEHAYNAYGERTSTIQYAGAAYDVSGLGLTVVPTEVQMSTWVSAQDRTLTTRVDMAYDYRGQLQRNTAYTSVDATGAGVPGATASITQYVYDQAGMLLSTISPANNGSTVFTYDGLGRVLTSQDALNHVTVNVYDDAHNKTQVTLVNGLATTSTYDGAGRLVSVLQSAPGAANLGVTKYFYDANNRLVMTEDPTGVRQWMLYDVAGRKVGDIDADGSLFESVYNSANQIIQTIRYEDLVNTAALVDAAGNPTNVALGTIRPSSWHLTSWNLYDSTGRLAKQIDVQGYVTETRYDGASRVTDVIRYANAINPVAITASTKPTDAVTAPGADATDRHTRSFYDKDGRLVASLDGEGNLSENTYDAAGRLIHSVAYANPTSSGFRAAGTLTQLRPAADNAHDIHSWNFYDAQSRLTGSIDGEGYLTEILYDASGHKTQTIRYSNRALSAPESINAALQLGNLRPASSPKDQTTRWTYSTLNQVTSQTDAEGTVTQYTYDSVGNILTTSRAEGMAEVRTLTARYDAQGHLTGELNGEGSAALAALGGTPTQAQLDALWASYGTRHSYDPAGRRTSSTDAAGNKTLYFYDTDGRQTHVVNALGEVQRNQYDALGQLIASVRYGTRIALTGLSGGLVSTTLTNAINAVKNPTFDSITSYSYTTRGELRRTWDALDNMVTRTYNAFGNVTTVATELGSGQYRYDVTAYDRNGLSSSSHSDEDGVNATMSVHRDAFGRVVSTTDANGNTTFNAYDRLGRQIQSTDPLNVGRSTTYDAFSRVATQTDGNGFTTEYFYNDATRSFDVKTPDGVVVSTWRNRHGERVSVRDGNGSITDYHYDRNGNLRYTDVASGSLNLRTEQVFDTANRLIETVDPVGTRVAYTYDAANRLLTRTLDPTGLNLPTTYEYDAKGQLFRETDPVGRVRTTSYYLDGQIKTQTADPAGLNLQTSYTYDARGKTLTVTEAAGTATAKTTRYTYDKLGRRTVEQVDPAGLNLTTRYAYDKNDNLVSKTDATGAVSYYAYDAKNRLNYSVDATGAMTETQYDGVGNVTSTRHYAGTVSKGVLDALGSASGALNPGFISNTISNWAMGVDGAGSNFGSGVNLNADWQLAGETTLWLRQGGTEALSSYLSMAPVSVSAGKRYEISAYTGAHRATASLEMVFFDAAGNRISTLAPTGGDATNAAERSGGATLAGYKRLWGFVTAPAGAVSASLQIRKGATYAGNGDSYAFVAHIYVGEAGATQVTASPLDLHPIVNAPSLLSPSMSGWAMNVDGANTGFTNGVDLDPYWKLSGEPTLWLRQDGGASTSSYLSSPKVNVSAGNRYDVSAYTGAHRATVSLEVAFFDAAGNLIGTATPSGDTTNPAAMNGGSTLAGYERLWGSVTAPTGAVTASLRVRKAPTYAGDGDSYVFLAHTYFGETTAQDRLTRFAYDAAGRQRFAVDGEGYVTEQRYDAAGQVVNTLHYDRAFQVSATPTEAELAAATQSVSTDFASDLEGFTGGGGVWEAGRLKLISQPVEGGSWDGIRSPRTALSLGSAVKFDLTPNDLQQALHAGIDGGSPYGRLVALLQPDGHVYAQTNNATTTAWNTVDLGTYAPGTTYTVEIDTSVDGSATLYFYAKGANREEGYSYQMESAPTWQTFSTVFYVNRYATLPGQTTAYVDNIEERAAGAQVTRYAYDAAGRQTYSEDAVGAVTEHRYDDLGHVIETIRYAKPIGRNLVNLPYTSDSRIQPVASEAAGLPAGGTAYLATDRDGFVGDFFAVTAGEQIDLSVEALKEGLSPSSPFGIGLYYSRDGVEYNAFVRAAVLETGSTSGIVAGRLTVPAGYRYAKVMVQLDGPWGQTGSRYFRNVEASRVGSTAASTATDADLATLVKQQLLSSAADRHTQYAFDAAGRRTFAVDATGGVTRQRYDASGNVIESIRYGQRYAGSVDDASLAAFYANAANQTSFDRGTRVVYDAAGRATFTIDALGGVVQTVYDAHGNMVRSIAWADTVNPASITDSATIASVRALLPTSSISSRETIYTYDAAGRQVHTATVLSASGATKNFTVTERQYNGLGQVTKTIAYEAVAALQELAGVISVAQMAGRVTPQASKDRSVRYVYDQGGRVTQSTDGEGFSEYFGYDAAGNKTSYTNKNGAVFNYSYDRLGQLISELSPTVSVTSLDGSLNAITPPAGVRIETRMAYDAFGQLLSRTETYGRPEQRTTRYTYDSLGHQTNTTFEGVGVYNAAADNLASNGISGAGVARHDATQVLSTRTVYDAFGQAIINLDVSGNYSYKTYDKLGRLVNEVDAKHNATNHFYSSVVGEYEGFTRMEAAAAFSDGLNVRASAIDSAVAAIAITGTPRSVSTTFDRLGREVAKYDAYSKPDKTGAAYSFDSIAGSAGQGGQWLGETRYAYNVWGEITTRTTQIDRATNRTTITYYGYDYKGGLLRQVDPEGYVTTYSKNAFGEDVGSTQYATKIDTAVNAWADPVALTASVGNTGSAIGYDRTTTTVFDRRGIKTKETAVGVVLGKRIDASHIDYDVFDVITDTQSDGVGNTTKTSKYASNNTSFVEVANSYYDALGRLTASIDGTGRTTAFKRDALGQALQTTRYAGLSVGNGALPTASANDQTTTQVFDKLGHVTQSRDATGADKFFSYDARGNVAKQWTPFQDVDGAWHNAIQLFDYDQVGQQTGTRTLQQRTNGATAAYSADTATYNAFGEVTSKQRDGTPYAYYEYDVGGRVWRTNADDGVDKVYLYDLQGNVTSLITSATVDLKAYGDAAAVPTTQAAGMRSTLNKYDKRGKLIEQANLGVTHLDGSHTEQLVRESYDAWGNVLSYTSTKGYVTNYRYNGNNQVTEEKKPTTTYYLANGSSLVAQPTTNTYYDAWGRNIGTRDAKGNVTTAVYLATGELDYEYHADGGIVNHDYDAFGRETRRDSANVLGGGLPNGRTYIYAYDKANRMLNESVYGRALYHSNGGSEAPDSFTWGSYTFTLGTYTYDQLGNRTSETSGADDKTSGVTQKYIYDTAGRLISSSNPAKATTWEYNTAGQKSKEIDGLGNTTQFDYSPQGRITSKVDIGGATTKYGYNLAGQITSQTSNRGQDLSYTYYEDGALKSINDGWNKGFSTFDYDSDGNKTIDRFAVSAGVLDTQRNVNMSYDELGRLAHVVEAAGNLYDLTYTYDANGNRYRINGTYSDADFEEYSPDTGPGTYYNRDNDGLSRRKLDMTYTYDAMNQVTGTGSLVYTGASTAPVEAFTWEYMSYDKEGMRLSHTKNYVNTGASGQLAGRVVNYQYDFAGRVAEASVISNYANGSGGQYAGTERAHRKNIYSTSGWTQEWQWAKGTAVDSFNYVDQAADRVLVNQSNYDAEGRVTSVTGSVKGIGGSSWYYTSLQTSLFDAAGNLKSSHIESYSVNNQTTAPNGFLSTSKSTQLDYKYTYLKMDGYRQRTSALTVAGWNGSAWVAIPASNNTTTQDYDVNGQVLQISDVAGNSRKYLVTDNAGHIVRQVMGRTSTAVGTHAYTGTYDANTGAQASTGATTAPTAPAPIRFDTHLGGVSGTAMYQQRLMFANDQQMGALTENSRYIIVWKSGEVSYQRWTYDINMNFADELGSTAVQTNEGAGFSYTVQSGDTLKALAQTFYGDANLWYVIGEANAVMADAPLVAGQQIRIPSVTRSSNTATTFKVYQPGQVIGSTDPSPIPLPPPPAADKGCGGIGTILVIIVAVVVTIYTAGAATAAMGPILAGAVGGAAGSIASQAMANVLGMQSGFNWKQVAISAIGGAVTAGLGETTAGKAAFGTVAAETSKGVALAVRAATSSIMTQGISVATGLQEHFSWRAVAVSAIAAPLATKMGDLAESSGLSKVLGGADSIATRSVTGFASGVLTQRVRMAIYHEGKLDYRSIAADAFGNAIGAELTPYAHKAGVAFGNALGESLARGSSAAEPVASTSGTGGGSTTDGGSGGGTFNGLKITPEMADKYFPIKFSDNTSLENDPLLRMKVFGLGGGERVRFPTQEYATVRDGDTLGGITGGDKEMFGRYIAGMGLRNPNNLQVGQNLVANWNMGAEEAVALANRFYAADAQDKGTRERLAILANASSVPGGGICLKPQDNRPWTGDTVGPEPSGFNNVVAAVKAYVKRDDVTLSQAWNAAWGGGGRDLASGLIHSTTAAIAADFAVFTSPTVVGSVGFGLYAVQQGDAAVADYRRFFGDNDSERRAQSLLTQGVTSQFGPKVASDVNTGIDFVAAVAGTGFAANALRLEARTVVDPLQARYTQSTISGAGLEERVANARAGLDMRRVDMVRWEDGSLASVDNRSIFVARQAASEYEGYGLRVRLREADQLLVPSEVERFTLDTKAVNALGKRGFTDFNPVPQTWGDAARLRILYQETNSAGRGFSTVSPTGSLRDPRITGLTPKPW